MDSFQEPAVSGVTKRGWWSVMGVGGKISFVVITVVVVFALYISLDANKFKATVRAVSGESVIGVNPTSESLDFGDMSRGSSVVRRVTLENKTGIPVFVKAVTMGSIADLVDQDKNNFKLKPREKTTIEFTLFMPASASIDKTYAGRVMIFRIPTFF